MKKLLLIALLPFTALAQDTISAKKTNPVIYSDFIFGGAAGSSHGVLVGLGLNYQRGSNLFTLRWAGVTQLDMKLFNRGSEPRYIEEVNDYGILYGRRYIFGGKSLSVSAGASLYRRDIEMQLHGVTNCDRTTYIGFPFEVDFKIFKKTKVPYHIYGIIPVGKPTAIGNSFGVKVIGSISHTGFIGVGLTFGLGMHKEYN